MNCRNVKTNHWYYGVTPGGQAVKVYISSNSRSEGPKGFYVRGGGVGYGVVKVENPDLELNETELLEANHSFSRTSNLYCREVARTYFNTERVKAKSRSMLTFPENPSTAFKVLAILVMVAVATFCIACLFL